MLLFLSEGPDWSRSFASAHTRGAHLARLQLGWRRPGASARACSYWPWATNPAWTSSSNTDFARRLVGQGAPRQTRRRQETRWWIRRNSYWRLERPKWRVLLMGTRGLRPLAW